MKVLIAVLFCLVVLVVGASAAAVTPESAKGVFDGWAVGIMLVWGVACKYFPPLAKIPNATIGWVNFLGYVLSRLATGTAIAGPLDAVPGAVGMVIGGMTNASWAMVLYETLGRTLMERFLGIKKAVPTPA